MILGILLFDKRRAGGVRQRRLAGIPALDTHAARRWRGDGADAVVDRYQWHLDPGLNIGRAGWRFRRRDLCFCRRFIRGGNQREKADEG